MKVCGVLREPSPTSWPRSACRLLLRRGHLQASLFLLALLSACTVKSALETPRPTPFLSRPELLQKPAFTPFALAWRSPEVQTYQYDVLVVQAVRTDQVDLGNWVFSTSSLIPTEAMYQQKLHALADYIQKAVTDRFEEESDEHDEKGGLREVQQGVAVEKLPPAFPLPSPPPANQHVETIEPPHKTLELQLSVSDANFGDPILYGGLLAAPVPGVANLSSAVKAPSLTIEAKFIDSDTGKVVAELIDRRFPPVKPVDLNRLTVSSPLHKIADGFADDLVRSFYRKPGQRVGRRLPFSLIPW